MQQNSNLVVTDGTGSAKISETGLLTAKANGTVTVKATAKDGSGTVGEKVIAISGQAVELITVSLEVPAEEVCPYHIDVIVLNASTSEPITGLVKEYFTITFGESGSYLIDVIGEGGMDQEDGHYTLYPNDTIDVYCPIIGYNVRIPVGSYTLEFSKTGYQDASSLFEIVGAAGELATAKTNAKTELNSYVDAADYTTNVADLAAAIANGITAIDGAADMAGVDTALQAAKDAIDLIESDADIAEAQDNLDISAAKGAIEAATYTATQAEVGVATEALTKAQALVDALELAGTEVTVVAGDFTAATAGTIGLVNGTEGFYTFTVKINKGVGIEVTTAVQTMVITATKYVPAIPNGTLLDAEAGSDFTGVLFTKAGGNSNSNICSSARSSSKIGRSKSCRWYKNLSLLLNQQEVILQN